MSEDVCFNDQDYINYLLSLLKELEKQYCLMMMEASSDWLYQLYRDFLLDVSCLERKVYHTLFLNGWYLLEKVDEDILKEKYQAYFKQYKKLSTLR